MADKNKEAEDLLQNMDQEMDKAKTILQEQNTSPQAEAEGGQVQKSQVQESQQSVSAQAQPRNEPVQHPVQLHSVYLKDMSFESPNTPAVFAEKWQPKVELQVNNKHRRVDKNAHELVLHLTISCKQEKHHAFFIELEQAGLFEIVGLNKQQVQRVLSTFCAEILFPYARATVDNILLQGGFPALKLAPINFVQAYEASLKQAAEKI